MGEYQVKPNWCRCHPETCCCDHWAIVNPDGSKHSTHYAKEHADEYCQLMNANKRLKQHEEIQNSLQKGARL